MKAVRELPGAERQRVMPSRHITLSREVTPSAPGDATLHTDVTYRAEFRTVLSYSGVAAAATENIHAKLHERAVRTMIHELYGPLYDDLMELRQIIWEHYGPGAPVEQKIDEILRMLR